MPKTSLLKQVRGKLGRAIRAQTARIDPPSVPLGHVIIGLGAQKSGTTWLGKVLAEHPDIYIRKKEVHYWDTVRAPYVSWDSVDRILASQQNAPGSPFGSNPLDHRNYLASLEFGRSDERIACEITPAYALCTQKTFSEMNSVHSDVRFVFLMRDPVDRLWSGLRHKMRASLDRGGSQDWLEKMFFEACENPYDPDLRRSRYDETLQALEGAGCNVSVMFYENLFTDQQLQALADFLGVDRLAGKFDSRVNVGAGKSLSLSETARSHGRKALEDTYDFVEDRFRDRVPPQWFK